MSKLNVLPVPPEFVEVLAESAMETAVAHLKKNKAPQELISLVENIHNLGYYLKICYLDPQSLTGKKEHRFGIEEVVIETVDAIAKLGGEFHGPSGTTLPRTSKQAKPKGGKNV